MQQKTMSAEEAVVFPKILHPQSLAVCLTEVLKCILYANAQIPLTYEQLLGARGAMPKPVSVGGDCHASKPQVTSLCERKFQERLRKLQELLSSVHSACKTAGHSLREMVVVLGATLVSPKVAYRIKLQEELVDREAAVLPQENLRRYTVKNLLSITLGGDLEKLPPTSCFVLFLAPRSSTFEKSVLPKTTFKIVSRGKHVVLQLSREIAEKCGKVTGDTASVSRKNSSGVDKVNRENSSGVENTRDTAESHELASLFEQLSLTEDDYIWFQIATVFHGFRDLPTCTYTSPTCTKPGTLTSHDVNQIWN